MMTRTNSTMLELLGGDPEFFEPNALSVPDRLIENLRMGFKDVDGCVVPSSFDAQQIWGERRPKTVNADDETAYECSWSEVHVEDFLDPSVPLAEIARIGLGYAMYLRRALLDSYLCGTFRIIVDVQLADAEIDVGSVCTVRFHRLRSDQAWLDDNIDNYHQNALLILDWENSDKGK